MFTYKPEELIWTGSPILECDESPTGYVLRENASPVDEPTMRYTADEPVNPADGDDVARATFAAMDRIRAHHAARKEQADETK